MKKILSVLLAVLMLCSFAFAEGEVIYRSDLYEFALPEGWMSMDSETFDAMIDALEPMIREQLGLTDEYIQLVRDANLDIFYGPDFTSNFNVTAQPVPGMTTADVVANFDSIIAGLEEMGGSDFVTYDSLVWGDKEMCGISMNYMGMVVMDQVYYVENEVMYSFTFTAAMTEEVDTILESLVIY